LTAGLFQELRHQKIFIIEKRNTKKHLVNMKSFKDIEFKPHSFGEGLHGLIFFDNGYGLSVVRFKSPLSKQYSSYTSNEDEWEVAVIYGNEKNWGITYETHLTDDVLGHQTEGEVDWIMIQIQEL
jgi:hypothetical protein